MPVLKLYEQADPRRVLETRALRGGALTVGRDPGPFGWSLRDPERAISRSHFEIREAEGRVTVRDLSTNGLSLAGRRTPLPPGEEVGVELGEVLRLGRLSILVAADDAAAPVPSTPSPFAPPEGVRASVYPRSVEATSTPPPPIAVVDEPPSGFDGPFSRPMLAPDPDGTVAVPSDWLAGGPPPEARASSPGLSDASLLEAFCAGAKLDLSALSGEEARETMHELGAVYRQMVLGLSDLMNERITAKAEFRMSRTTVRAEGNNPFKWAPAQRVAVDLLLTAKDGFLPGPAAVNECFRDLKKHVLCLLAGGRASLAATLDALHPDRAEAAVEGRAFLMRTRAAAVCEAYRRLHGDYAAEAGGNPDSRANQAFRQAYEARLHELDAQTAV